MGGLWGHQGTLVICDVNLDTITEPGLSPTPFEVHRNILTSTREADDAASLVPIKSLHCAGSDM